VIETIGPFSEMLIGELQLRKDGGVGEPAYTGCHCLFDRHGVTHDLLFDLSDHICSGGGAQGIREETVA
jgi:hypothetical protein